MFPISVFNKADVLVNSTAPNLALNSGILSKLIFKAAGNSILQEIALLHPNGLSSKYQVAYTSAGKMDNFKFIFHVAVGNYEDPISSKEVITVYY